jgi:hypothetical protein
VRRAQVAALAEVAQALGTGGAADRVAAMADALVPS